MKITNLSLSYDHPILTDVAFTAPAGKVTALVGPNGAGKSTLLSAVAGLNEATGSIRHEGHDVTALGPKQRARIVSFVPQDTALSIGFTAFEVVAMGRYPHRGRWEPETERDRELATKALQQVGATSLADAPVNQLSGGQRQLIHIARAVAQDTPVILLDEPVSALDLKHQVAVLELLGQLSDQGKAVLVVLHDLNLVARWCHRAVLLEDGHVRAEGTTTQVLTKDNLERVYQLPLSVEPHRASGAMLITPKPVAGAL
ncbi:ABC transporter ATP-binding protein [Corynebacterium hindlerae]|uniref:ABC transporter ATP-binding protein n=1 Tax=Corynebacterium hindlerae TaxID=699041 RepID=A0A7G5FC83_9CORY|nr:ABC transporter ATP-binding protein [Corynebacterium hindlerae]QMV84224.1 ABC transporter ATP-binding protein [Corynebacterium hindlerae]